MGADGNRGPARRVSERSAALARECRRLGRAATVAAVLTSPAPFVALHVRKVAQEPELAAPENVDKELYGDDVTSLLDGVGLRKPSIDVLEERAWPAI